MTYYRNLFISKYFNILVGVRIVCLRSLNFKLSITNPDKKEVTSCLFIQFAPQQQSVVPLEDSFLMEINKIRNELTNIPIESMQYSIKRMQVGIFDCKADGVYATLSEENSIFLVVLSGSCETQGRLLETKDSILFQKWGK